MGASSDLESPATGRRMGERDGAEPAEELLRTKEILEATGISHQVLYRYVTLGLIEPAATTKGGQRLFHPRVISLIESVQGLNQTGYSLRDIKEIFFKDGRVHRLCGEEPPEIAPRMRRPRQRGNG